MPSISESLANKINTANLRPVAHVPTVEPIQSPNTRSVFLRCPVPPIGVVSVDNLDQYNLRGAIPQYRIFTSN